MILVLVRVCSVRLLRMGRWYFVNRLCMVCVGCFGEVRCCLILGGLLGSSGGVRRVPCRDLYTRVVRLVRMLLGLML